MAEEVVDGNKNETLQSSQSETISVTQRSATNGYKPRDFYDGKIPTVIEIKNVIPSHCFKPKLSTSLYYVGKDVCLVIFLYAAMEGSSLVLPSWCRWVVTPVYWILQGTVFTGIFVLGHDCGHGSFSSNGLINDLFGNISHTFLLTPYYQWKLSHSWHHKNTGNIDKDEVFYPIRSKWDSGKTFLPLFGLGIGWFVYLVRGYKPRQVHHFNVSDSMFQKHVAGCTVSLGSYVIWLVCLYHYSSTVGIWPLLHNYVVPVLVFASFIVMITFLHHTEERVPWYADHHWEYVIGQLSSIDRHYGWAHELIHNIGTHQIHHLFSKIPHYHLEEASSHFRKAFPHLVRYKKDGILSSFVRMFRKFQQQSHISNETDIHTYN